MSPDHQPPPPPDPEDDEAPVAEAAAAEFAAALEAFDSTHPAPAAGPRPRRRKPKGERTAPRVGQRLSCRVVSLAGDSVLLEIGGRSEGVADAREFRNEDGTWNIEVGQTLELFVVESGEQVVLARAARSRQHGSLASVREARTAGLPVRGKVTAVNSGGLAVEVDGVQAFCPLSQIDIAFVADPAPLVGRVLEFIVTEVDESRHRVVLSRRRLLQREQEARARERLATLAPGQELEGTVTRMEPFGAFVDLGGLEGLVHVSEVSHARVAHPREVLSQGEKVRVKVLRVEPGKDGRPRVALSVRASAPDPWSTAAAMFSVGARVPGVVVRLAEFGAFVNLAPGLDGLVHISQVSDHRVQNVSEILSPGQAVEATVLAVEPERRRISLSLRETQEPTVAPSRMSRAPAKRDRPDRPDRPAQGGRARRASGPPRSGPPREREEWRPTPPPVDDSPTQMQIAFRRAREAAERRERKP